jgi:cell division septation protein DedD
MKATRLAVCLLALALALSACSRRQSEWETARSADTVESYERFLKAFPSGEFSAQAQARAEELREARDWKKAVAANSLGAYQQFIAQYPDGRMGDEARIRIESLTLAGAPADAAAYPPTSTLPMANTGPTLATAPSAPPTPAGATATLPSPQAKPAASGSAYRIQLGAFSGGEKQAMGEWRRLQREFPQLLNGLSPSVKFATTSSGHLYRLQAGATDEARARDICSKLQDQGQACVVVPP